MKLELDKKGLETLVSGCYPNYNVFNNPLIKKAGHKYMDQNGRTYWENLKGLSEEELFLVYKICVKSWDEI
tara:strand:- start:15 stop:227 length:213 start_codon:yes stop_codon:yes gene_type:complete